MLSPRRGTKPTDQTFLHTDCLREGAPRRRLRLLRSHSAARSPTLESAAISFCPSFSRSSSSAREYRYSSRCCSTGHSHSCRACCTSTTHRRQRNTYSSTPLRPLNLPNGANIPRSRESDTQTSALLPTPRDYIRFPEVPPHAHKQHGGEMGTCKHTAFEGRQLHTTADKCR